MFASSLQDKIVEFACCRASSMQENPARWQWLWIAGG